jgi:hypothetical protein
MSNRSAAPERWTMVLLAMIAAVTFFLPLFSIHVPIAGDQDVTGYDSASRIRQLTHEVRSASGQGEEDGKPSIKLPKLPRGKSSAPSGLPLAVRLSWLIPAFIIGAFCCALLTLLGSLVSFRLSRIASTVGTAFGVLALLHLTLMDSDIHNLLEESIRRGTAGLEGNPLAGLAQALGNALINAVSLKPGAGLYVLTGSLGLAAFLAHSRLLSRLRLTGPVS